MDFKDPREIWNQSSKAVLCRHTSFIWNKGPVISEITLKIKSNLYVGHVNISLDFDTVTFTKNNESLQNFPTDVNCIKVMPYDSAKLLVLSRAFVNVYLSSKGFCGIHLKPILINLILNTLRPRRNEQHFADDIFKHIFFNENVWILIKISPKFVPWGPINNIPSLV